ncbi:MAG: hypothetical protein R3A45_05270 [Bdellovibrionota bacterium]
MRPKNGDIGINANAEPNMPYLTVKVEGADINHLQAMAVCSAGGCRIGTRDSQVTVENIAPGGDVCILKLQDISKRSGAFYH